MHIAIVNELTEILWNINESYYTTKSNNIFAAGIYNLTLKANILVYHRYIKVGANGEK